MTGHASKSRATAFSYETGVFCPHWSDMLDTEDPCDKPCATCGHPCHEHWLKARDAANATNDWACHVEGCACIELTGNWRDG